MLVFGLRDQCSDYFLVSMQLPSFRHTSLEDVGGEAEKGADSERKDDVDDGSTIGHSGPFGRQWVVIIRRVKRASSLKANPAYAGRL